MHDYSSLDSMPSIMYFSALVELVYPLSEKISIKSMTIQIQKESMYCGLFAITLATAYCHHHGPTACSLLLDSARHASAFGTLLSSRRNYSIPSSGRDVQPERRYKEMLSVPGLVPRRILKDSTWSIQAFKSMVIYSVLLAEEKLNCSSKSIIYTLGI